MPRNSLRFPLSLRIWLWGSLGMLFVTGLLWLGLHYGTQTDEESGPAIHPAEPWLLRLHGLGAFVTLLVLGAVYVRHLHPAWQAKRNRGSGALLTGSLGLLILSGYGLYYFAGDALRSWTGFVHNALGIALPFVVAGHILRGKAGRPKNHFPPAGKHP
jgi:hypothetical protein